MGNIFIIYLIQSAGYDKVVEVLVQNHAKVNVINKSGQSALDAVTSLNGTEGNLQAQWVKRKSRD